MNTKNTAIGKFIIPILALIGFVGFFFFMQGFQGVIGLFKWHFTLSLAPFLILAILPLAIMALTLGMKSRSTGEKILRSISLGSGLLVLLVCAALTGFLIFAPRSGTLGKTAIQLLDPSAGIVFRDPLPATDSAQAERKLKIALSSDPHWGKASANPQARLAILTGIETAQPGYDAFFMLGDTVELGVFSSEWREAQTDLEAILKTTPVRPIMGNHDAIGAGEYNYRRAFFPASMHSDSLSPYYFTLDSPRALFIILNLPWGTEKFDSAQRRWLEKILAQPKNGKARIVLSHSYFWASGYKDPRTGVPWYDHQENLKEVAPLLETGGVDLAIAGHNHYMELLEKNNVTYAIIGAMGGVPDPAPSYLSPASLWIKDGIFGWLELNIGSETIAMTYKDQSGAIIKDHSVTIRK